MTPWTRTWFLPQTPDFLGMLGRQAEVTLEGMRAFAAWVSGDREKADNVRELEHQADSARRELLRSVQDAFTTPLPKEDLFEISIQFDDVINSAKTLSGKLICSPCPPSNTCTTWRRTWSSE
jgi:uncharacterized protein Yka (UPF0111/DUF47 family)